MPELAHPLTGVVVRGSVTGRARTAPEYEVVDVSLEQIWGAAEGARAEFAVLRRLDAGAPGSEPPGSMRRVAVDALDRYRVIGRADA